MRIATAAARALRTSRRAAASHSGIRISAWLLKANRYQTTVAAARTSCRMASTSSSKILSKDKTYDEHWQQPEGTPLPNLKVFNSLTRSKVDFVPQKGKHVTWYNCGPTVYDASHMGHARNYVTQDFLRRILRDYFKYDVHFVMNITDIDDKIILRARHQHLFSTYLNETGALTPEVLAQAKKAWSQYFEKFNDKISTPPPSYSNGQAADNATTSVLQSTSALTWEELQSKITNDAQWLKTIKDNHEKFGMQFDTLTAARNAIEKAEKDISSGRTDRVAAADLLKGSQDIISELLDRQKGSTVTDPAIFRSLAAYWEKSFFDDMDRLHVEPPVTLTRVSEYLPEITTFVEKIIENGYAYEGDDGSVYFDTKRFDGAKGKESGDWCHSYAKLQPWSKGNKELLEDGEGSLSVAGRTKKSPSDFALWKASKPGEPAWPSKWGMGRPGWHIECSVMASDVLGKTMDIHSGGVDLAFPHHDNEIAQSEAHHECRQWVNYFLHTGHLHIEGLKMSKSLKNFITIEEALARATARQLRLSFLLQQWNARMDFNEKDMTEVKAIETRFNNFFTNVNALVSDFESRAQESSGCHHYGTPEKELMAALEEAQDVFHAALCDSFNTPQAMSVLITLLTSANVYVTSRSRSEVNVDTLRSVSDWLSRMLRVFGLGEGPEADARGKRIIGWGQARAEGANGAVGEDREASLMPYLRALSTFRDSVRRLAREEGKASEILALCDQLRDNDMIDLGVALDDQDDGRALVKLVPADQLRAARDEKAAIAKQKAAQKAASQAAAEAKRKEKLEKGKLAPKDMFKNSTEYSKFDSEGLPTHDAQGEELPKSRVKKLKKEYDQQAKLHEAYLAEEH